MNLIPIGTVVSTRTAPEDDDWDAVAAHIALDPAQFTADALAGLDAFSHIDVIYGFHKVPTEKIVAGSRHPRGRADWPKVGIFAQRAKDRPNRLGLTTCRLQRVNGLQISVVGLDAIDGTPVFDIKPCMREFLPRGDVRQPAWATELMRNYWSRRV
jgi:tRNA-Thr(GGU) m(6)t(6)A37 methyltransferase TsaA